jgi:hypothetical protein
VPPPYEAFELRMKIPKGESGGDDRKQYDVNISEEGEEAGSFYKSRITYQVSTQYRQKGKYQVDSSEEGF